MTTFDGSAWTRWACVPRPLRSGAAARNEGRPQAAPRRLRLGRLVARPWGWGFVGVAAAAGPVAGARPRRPEDHRDHEADRTDDHQDPADRVLVDAADVTVDPPDEDGSGGDQ